MKKITSAALLVCLIGCYHGNVIITGTKRAPVSVDSVNIYDPPPAHYDVIGIINAHGNALTISAAQQKAMITLKEKAAEIGANGIIDVHIAPNNMEFVCGKAIWVPIDGR